MTTANIGIRLSATGAAQVRGELDQAAGGMERLGAAGAAVERTVGSLRNLFAGLIGAATVGQLVQAADAVTNLNSQLRLATGNTQLASQAYDALFQIAQRSRVSFTELGGTFASIARATEGLGVSQDRLLRITEAIGAAITLSGSSAAGAQAALVQLGQGLASGALRGEELNSVMEQTPRLARALADGLGVSIGQLRELGQQGKITAAEVLRALESQGEALRSELGGSALTVGGALTQLRNSATRFVGDMDTATGASSTLAKALSGLSGTLDSLGAVLRENGPTIAAVLGSLSGAALLAALPAIVSGIKLVAGAVVTLGAALVANPLVLALLGIGAVVGGSLAYGAAQARTVEGMRDTVASLEALNARSEAALQRAVEGGRTAGADNIRATIAARREEIFKLRLEIEKLQGDRGRGDIVPTLPREAPPDTTVAAEAARRAQAERALMAERSLKAIAAYERAEAQLDEQLRKSTQAELELAAARSLREQANVDAAEAAADRSLAGAQEMVRAIQDETAALTMSNTEREVAIALLQLERLGLEKGSAAYELYADKIRDAVVSREATRESIEQTRQIEAEWQRTSDQIGQALTDALMNGGKNAAEYLKGLFRSLVLRPAIEAVVRPFARQLAGAMNAFMGNTDAQGRPQAGGGFSMGRGFGDSVAFGANDLGDWLTRNTSGALNQAGSWMMENANKLGSVANTLSNAAGYIQALQAADDGKWGQAIGTAVGQYFGGPMGAMLGNTIGGWLDKIFSGGAGTPHMGSAIRTLGDGTQVYMPGVVGFDRGTDQALRALGMASTGSVNALSGAFGGPANATSTIAFAADGNDASIGNLQLSMGGRTLADIGGTDWAKYASDPRAGFEAFGMDVVRATRSALDSLELPAWAREQLEAFDAELAKLGDGNLEAATDLLGGTVQAIAELQSGMVALQRYMEPLGGVFLRVSDLSGDAMKQLVDFAGGIEALGQQTQGFVQNYFSREEIAGLQSREIRDTLLGAGFTEGQLAGLDTRGEFRSLLESVDTSTEAGRRQLAALLGVSDTFAGLSDYFASDGGDLLSAAGQAPNTGALTPPGAAPGAQATESPAVVALGSIDRGIADAVAVLREVRDTLRTAPRVAITVPGNSEVQVAP
jgi:tape measure domain-containing protein